MAAAEEYCICKRSGHGCIIVFSIEDIARWNKDAKVFSHEVGHTLGVYPHADNYYESSNEGTRNLIMWPAVHKDAVIWSPWARDQIKSQNNSCLKTVQPHT